MKIGNVNRRVIRNLRKRGVKVYTRRQWGTRRAGLYQERRKAKPVRLPVDTLVQHITVTYPSGDLRKDARTVEDIGYARFLSGTSYNFLVDMKTGEVAIGQPLDAKGTHTVNYKGVPDYSYDLNAKALAIAVVGLPDTPLSHAAEVSLRRIMLALVEEGALTNTFDYDPHSMFASKDCPCEATRGRMPHLRNLVGLAMELEPRRYRL